MNHPAVAAGHVAVITGAASGIGRAAAHALGTAGMRLVLADIDAGTLDQAAAELRAEGADIVVVRTDVSCREDIVRLKAEADRCGKVSLLMNNAGREGGGGLFADPDRWRAVIETNLLGALHGIQLFVPDMMTADWPCAIINTGSKQGITLPPGDTAYNVSKAGLKALTESLAHELLSTGDRVTAHLLIPGFTFTGFTRARGVAAKPPGAWTAEQVVGFMLESLARGDFYILCPDNDVSRSIDEKRIRWAAEDIIENRPALSRWNPDYTESFKAYMQEEE